MRILKYIPIILVIITSCSGNSEEAKLNKEAEAESNEAIAVSQSNQESLSKKIDSIAYETDRLEIEALMRKAKKYKLNAGCNCNCLNTYSITNSKEITLQDSDNELVKFSISKNSKEIIFTITGSDTAAFYKPNNIIQFLDDKSKTITMFNHYVKHKQKSMVIVCDETENSENLAKLKLLQNRNIIHIKVHCLNSFNKDIDLNEKDSKMFKCLLNCN